MLGFANKPGFRSDREPLQSVYADSATLVAAESTLRFTGALVRLQPWVQAARPVALPLILLPLLMGQALFFFNQGYLAPEYLLYAAVFGVLYQIYLLYTNDHADEALDKSSEQYWLSGGSRVLPQGKLRGSDLRRGARIALVTLVALTLFLAITQQRPWMVVLLALSVLVCWAYNRPPLRLSYRGYGEILQGLGCGVLLPLIGYYLQQGTLFQFPWGALIPLYLLSHAGNIMTALPDYESDRKGGKHTFPVRHGERAARIAVLLLFAAAFVCCYFFGPSISSTHLAIVIMPAFLVLPGVVFTGLLHRADVANFQQCKRFVGWMSVSQAWFFCAWTASLFLGGRL